MLSVVALSHDPQMPLDTPQSAEALFHRVEALGLIQERLDACPVVNNGTIGAVASLTNQEVSEIRIISLHWDLFDRK